MPITTAWDETAPAGGDSPRQGDDEIRALKAAIRERARNGGHLYTPGSTDPEDGRHVCGQENASGGPGSPLAGEFYVYGADQTTRVLTVSDSTAASGRRLLMGDGIGGSEQFTFTAQTLRGNRDYSLAVPLPSGTTGRVSGLIYENRGAGSMTLLGVKLVAFTAPSGSALNVDIHLYASGYTNPTTGGTSIFDPNPHPTIAAGSRVGTEITTFATSALAVGEAIVFDIDALNGADNIVVIMRTRRTD